MCGITGYISSEKDILSATEFARFNLSLSHRGPDWQQQEQTKRGWIGHTKLSITEDNSSSNQPFSYISSEGILYQMVFNGEIYNFRQIREELKSLGHVFSTQSDTEVVIKSFAEWGEKCQLRFNGIWAFAIYKSDDGEIFLSRDRLGVKPLHLWTTQSAIFFASEVKSFRKLPSIYRLPASGNTISYLIKKQKTTSELKPGLGCLPAGHSVRINANNKCILSKWWTPESSPSINSTSSYSELVEQFKYLFFDALKLRMQDPSPKCTALSGGLDSSSVLCSTQQLISNEQIKVCHPYKAFCLNYSNTPSDEFNYALDVIKKSQIDLTLVHVSPNSPMISPDLIRDCIYSSEQLSNLFLGPFILYQAMSKEGYKVSIDGHGADELLGGYKTFARASIADCINQYGTNIELQELRDTWINAGVSADRIDALINKLSLQGQQKMGNNLRNKSIHEISRRMLPWILDTYDKIPMAHNIEVRSPFLDWRIVEFCLSIPSEAKIGGGFTKRILRDAMKDIIPNSIRLRYSKLGFAPPMASYLENKSLQSYILDIICSSNYLESKLFNGPKNRKLIESAITQNNLHSIAETSLWKSVQVTIFLNELERSI